MRKALIALAAVVVVGAIAVFGGSYVYANYINNDQPAAFSAVTTTTAAGAAPTTAGDATAALSDTSGTWAPTSASQVGYRVKEVLFGNSTEGVGRTNAITGSLTMNGLTLSAANFSVDMTTVKSDSNQRDSQFNGRIMQTSQYPTATFKLTQPITLTTAPSGTAQTVKANGELNLHGVTKPVSFDLQVQAQGNNVVITGAIPIVFADYNINNPSFSGVTTEDNGTLEMQLTFAKS